MAETYVQRMRVWFSTGETVKYVGHLDMHRAWERAIRRARLPLAYTQGFNPQPRMQFAAALPVGFTGSAEVADIFLNDELPPPEFLRRLSEALPPGIRPTAAEPVGRGLPSLQSQVTGAHYTVEVETDEAETRWLRDWWASWRSQTPGASGAKAKMSRATTCAPSCRRLRIVARRSLAIPSR